jgi:hypothetical protein
MSGARTKTNSVNRLKISGKTRRAYERRDKSLDHADPDAPVMPPEFWQDASIGKYYRPRKTQIPSAAAGCPGQHRSKRPDPCQRRSVLGQTRRRTGRRNWVPASPK